jgi:hypothetical protein
LPAASPRTGSAKADEADDPHPPQPPLIRLVASRRSTFSRAGGRRKGAAGAAATSSPQRGEGYEGPASGSRAVGRSWVRGNANHGTRPTPTRSIVAALDLTCLPRKRRRRECPPASPSPSHACGGGGRGGGNQRCPSPRFTPFYPPPSSAPYRCPASRDREPGFMSRWERGGGTARNRRATAWPSGRRPQVPALQDGPRRLRRL